MITMITMIIIAMASNEKNVSEDMTNSIWKNKERILNLLSYYKMHRIIVFLRNVIVIVYPLARLLGLEIDNISELQFLLLMFSFDMFLAFSITFYFLQLRLGNSPKNSFEYLLSGKIDKEWLEDVKECLKQGK